MSFFKDSGHLFRFAGIFVFLFLAFLVIRVFVVPKSFGEYGHYRGNAIKDMAAKPLHFAGHQACETCHTDVLDVKKTGKHAGVNCEACHGPLAAHAADPSAVVPAKLETASLCVRCHEYSAARPKTFPQVVSAQHSSGMPCETCHNPHNPLQTAGGAK
ncbi:MAG TPA: cytochrome c3 family protein [Terracidiphilus sp.]|nr:cytochrome c3 family protein [Terracidiphilus sp.]